MLLKVGSLNILNLQTVLTELARVRLHGFSEREVAAALEEQMADAACSYCERDQVYGEVCNSNMIAISIVNMIVLRGESAGPA